MMDFPVFLALWGAAALLLTGDEKARIFTLVMLEGGGILTALINIERGENYILWNLVALGITVVAMGDLGRLHDLNQRWPRRERKALKQLFGEPTNFWEMLIMDPRLRRNHK